MHIIECQEGEALEGVSRSSWRRFETLFPRLLLVPNCWTRSGLLATSQIACRKRGTFSLPEAVRKQIRNPHASEWRAKKLTNGELIGIRNLSIGNKSRRADGNLSRNVIDIEAHRYRYFDFLATHRLLSTGSPTERSLLAGYAKDPTPEEAIKGFPNSLSVGLALFCESGRLIVLAVRTRKIASGGHWQRGKVYNAVGENVVSQDFSKTETEPAPFVTAKRGLREEMGLSYGDEVQVALHSFAWASDIKDYKFFGYAITPISEERIREKWKAAPDRRENQEIMFINIEKSRECCNLWRRMVRSNDQWSPEAMLCTTRSLLLLGKLRKEEFEAEMHATVS